MITLICIWLIIALQLQIVADAGMKHGKEQTKTVDGRGVVPGVMFLSLLFWGAGWFRVFGFSQWLWCGTLLLASIQMLATHGVKITRRMDVFERLSFMLCNFALFYFGGLFAPLGLAP